MRLGIRYYHRHGVAAYLRPAGKLCSVRVDAAHCDSPTLVRLCRNSGAAATSMPISTFEHARTLSRIRDEKLKLMHKVCACI